MHLVLILAEYALAVHATYGDASRHASLQVRHCYFPACKRAGAWCAEVGTCRKLRQEHSASHSITYSGVIR